MPPSRAFGSAIAPAVAALTCMVMSVSGSTAPPAAAGAGRPRYGGMVRVEVPGSIASLDPAAALPRVTDSAARDALLPLAFETLTRVEAGGLQPLLADSWRSEAQDTRWTFHLRPGVRLHDGTPLTSAQVAAVLRAAATGWTVKETTDAVLVESDQPLPDLPWELARLRHAIVVPGPNGVPLGTGPFRVDRWEPGRRLALRADDTCRDGRPFVDTVQVEMARPPRDEVIDLEVGRADVIPLLPQDVRGVSQRGLRVAASSARELVAIVFDTRRPAASQEAVRNAVALSIDRAAICTVLLQRQADIANSVLPDWLSGYAAIFQPRYNRAAARSLVASLPPGRRTLSVEYPDADPVAQAIADRVAVDVREAGLALTAVPSSRTAGPPADARVVRLPLDVTSPDRALAALIAPLGLDSSRPPSPGAPIEAVIRFEQALVEPAVVVPLVHLPRAYGIGNRIESPHGSIVTPSGGLNLADVWIRGDKP